MRDATEALQRRQPGEAIGPQTEALDQLQQAARDFAQQMQRRMQGQWGNPNDDEVGATDGTPRDRVERDPLGRPMSNNGTYDQGDVKIPDQNTLQKAREILDELRRRAGERFSSGNRARLHRSPAEEILSLTEGKSAPSIR